MFYAVIIFATFSALYATLYYFDSIAPIPEGAEVANEACLSCSSSTCEIHPSKRIKEVE